jgi:hypothetical protein
MGKDISVGKENNLSLAFSIAIFLAGTLPVFSFL